MAWDVIVVGAGTAGMPLAIFAAKRGARVLVLEQAATVGGTLPVSAGQVSAAGTRLQAERGIADSPDIHYEDVIRISNGNATHAFARLAADNSADTLHWLLDLGWTPMAEHPVKFGHNPYSQPRTYWGVNAGHDLMAAVEPEFRRAIESGRVTLRLNTPVVELVQDKAGVVTGVVAREAGKADETITAPNVVLATGGYGASKALFPLFTNGLPGFGWANPTSNGSGHVLALRAGGEVKRQDYFLPRWAGVENPHDPARAERYTEMAPTRRPPWEICVDRHGRRFVAEDRISPDERERALLTVPDLTFWVVYDARIRRESPPLFDRPPEPGLDHWLGRHPSFCMGDSLDAVAKSAGIDSAGLAQTVADYNASVLSGRDAFGRTHMPLPIVEAPFYAIKHHGAGATTIPGIWVDTGMRVLRADGSVIPGLYAVGEILGMGLHSGDAFVGGMGLMPALTYGRLLGERWLSWGDAA